MLSFCVRVFFVTHTDTQIQTAGTDARRTRMPTKESLAQYKNGFIQLPVYFGKLVSFLQNPTWRGGGGWKRGEREGEMWLYVGMSWCFYGGIRIPPPHPPFTANNVILSHNSYSPGIHKLHFLVLSMLLRAAGVVSSQQPPPSASRSLSQ